MKKFLYIAIIAISVISIVSLFCNNKDSNNDKVSDKTTNTNSPEKTNILDRALQKVGIERSMISVPKYEERDYSLVAKLPLIDRIMNHPFELPTFWRQFSDSLNHSNKSFSDIYKITLGAANDNILYTSDNINQAKISDKQKLDELLISLFPDLKQETIDKAWNSDINNPILYNTIAKLATTLNQAAKYKEEAFADLSADEMKYLKI